MVNKCSAGNCKSNYSSQKGPYIPVYKLPDDPTERALWISALPNKVSTSNNVRICRLHWPSGDIPMVKKRRFSRPRDPPSVFNVPKSYFRQTASKSRAVSKRRITLEYRGAQKDELEEFVKRDCIGDWANFLSKLPLFCTEHAILLEKAANDVKLYFIKDDRVDFFIHISDAFNVCVKSHGKTLGVRDLLGFQHCLSKWSQLEAILTRAKNFEVSLNDKILYFGDILLKASQEENDLKPSCNFLLEQLCLLSSANNRYSTATIRIATEFFLSSRGTYSLLRRYFTLPHPDVMRRKLGPISALGTVDDARETIENAFSRFSKVQKNCLILFDEIYVKPSIRLRGNHVFGYAEDETERQARTVLVIMIKPLMGSHAFVVRLVPIFSLKSDFLYEQLLGTIRLISDCGGRAVALMGDCLSTNQKCYRIFKQKFSDDSCEPWKVKHPSDQNDRLFLLFDPTHLMKNIRNNWLTEAKKEMSFTVPGTDRQITGKWCDVQDLYEEEKDDIIRMTKLTQSSCNPPNIERQKMSLVMKVINEKTVAALSLKQKTTTAEFIDCLLRMWKILNVKSPDLHVRLNDRDREQITSKDHTSLHYLKEMAASFAKMPGGRGRNRIRSLTNETRDALIQTLNGLVEIAGKLLEDESFKYILLGFFQSDRIEGEFGVYRQMSGGCYHISVDQILCSTKLRRLKLYADLDSEVPSSRHMTSDANCCLSPFKEDELLTMDDSLLTTADDISENEMASLLFICGYIAFKEGLRGQSETVGLCEASEFLHLVSRGKLTVPPEDLVKFSVVCYGYFRTTRTNCVNRMVRIFDELYDACLEVFPNHRSICRRLANTFFRGLVNKEDKLQYKKESLQKVKKFSPFQ